MRPETTNTERTASENVTITDSRIPSYGSNEIYIADTEYFSPGFFDETDSPNGFFMRLY